MRLSLVAITLAGLLTTTTASPTHGSSNLKSRRHADIAARQAAKAPAPVARDISADLYAAAVERALEADPVKRSGQKKVWRKRQGGGSCKVRPANNVAVNGTTSDAAPEASSTVPAVAAAVPTTSSSAAWSAQTSASATPSTSSTEEWTAPSSSSSSEAAAATYAAPGGASGLLQMSSSTCGACPSTPDAPNGPEWWLNCGIDNGGWNPPHVTLDQLVYADLNGDGIFGACSAYIQNFKDAGAATGVPPIMLASFAMQESGCNAGAVGRNGEISLMQITPANCPAGANCWDPYTNIKVGSELFKNMLSHAGGNVLQAIGAYNGWQPGQTVGSVRSAAVCTQQQNLDYLFQFTNGWMQGIDGHNMGQYFNLAHC